MQYTECLVCSGRIKILCSKCKILFKHPRLKAFFSKEWNFTFESDGSFRRRLKETNFHGHAQHLNSIFEM